MERPQRLITTAASFFLTKGAGFSAPLACQGDWARGLVQCAILARPVRAFDMTLLYHDAVRKPELEPEPGVAYRTLDELLQTSDIVSVQVPITDETRCMIGERELRRMKRHAILINTARGAILDQAALYRALQEHWIAAAGLDVLAKEPIRLDSPLLKLDNVVLAPHLRLDARVRWRTG